MLNLEYIKNKLNTKYLGREIVYFEEIGSTQDYIRESSLSHGTVVISESQTAGKGTNGRKWLANPRR